MSISYILDDGGTPQSWSNLNINSLKTGIANIGNISVSDISVNNMNVESIAASSMSAYTIVASDTLEMNGLYFISSIDSFKNHGYTDPNTGIIQLHDNESYMFVKLVDLYDPVDDISYRIKCATNNTIFGPGLEAGGITSTGLGTEHYLIETNSTITIHDLKLVADPLIEQSAIKMVSSDGLGTADWTHVNFYGFGDAGLGGPSDIVNNTILCDSYTNVIWDTLGFLSSSNINFTNSGATAFQTIGIMNTIFQPKTGGNCINIDSNFECSRRFRISYSSFVGLGGTSLNIASDASIPVNSLILDTVNFGGFGTGCTISNTDNRALYTNCTGGISNTATQGELIMTNNATATIVSNTSDYYHVAGVASDGQFNQRFLVQSDNFLQYTGNISFPVRGFITCSLTSGNNNVIDVGLRKNGVLIDNSLTTSTANTGGRAENISTFGITSLTTSDYFDVVCRNKTSATNITVDKLHISVSQL